MLSTIKKAIKSVTKSVNVIEADFFFSQDDSIFAGHFPGKPVIPAVCLLQKEMQ
jgi:3-hydroxymyristoyl/3-hydroxydecanoyl-(acyl carrier protein) dehydratase